MQRRAFSQNLPTQTQTFLILKMEFRYSKGVISGSPLGSTNKYFYWTKVAESHFSYSNYGLGLIRLTANFLTNLKSPGSLENLFQKVL